MSKGYIAVFGHEIDKHTMRDCMEVWLGQFDRIEQVAPGSRSESTIIIASTSQMLWEENLQYRAMADDNFAWIYVTLGSRIMETSGLDYEDNLIPLEVFTELHGVDEVIDARNERRLEELEKEGLID